MSRAVRLRRAMTRLGWTRKQTSQALGVSVTRDGQTPTLRGWLSGHSEPPEAAVLLMEVWAGLRSATPPKMKEPAPGD